MIKNFLIYLFSEGISRLVPFLVLPILAYFLIPEDFGRVTNFAIFVQFLFVFINLNLNTKYTVEFFQLTELQQKRERFNALVQFLLLFFGLLILICFAHKSIAGYISFDFKWQVFALISALLNVIFRYYLSHIRMTKEAKLFALYQFLFSFLLALFSISLIAIFDFDWTGRVFAMVVTSACIVALLFFSLIRHDLDLNHLNWKRIKQNFSYGLPLLPHSGAGWVRTGFEKILITKKVGISQNGIYSLAATFGSVFQTINSAFFSAYSPHLMENLTQMLKSESNGRRQISKRIKYEIAITLGIYGFLLFIGFFVIKFLIETILNSDYHQSIVFLPFILISSWFGMIYQFYSGFIFFNKKNSFLASISITLAILQSLATIYLIELFEVMGAAYALVTFSIVRSLVVFVYGRIQFRSLIN